VLRHAPSGWKREPFEVSWAGGAYARRVPVERIWPAAEAYLLPHVDSTQRTYRTALRQWDAWTRSQGWDTPDPDQVSAASMEAFARHLEEDLGLSPASVYLKVGVVVGFVEWSRGELNDDLLIRPHPPRPDRMRSRRRKPSRRRGLSRSFGDEVPESAWGTDRFEGHRSAGEKARAEDASRARMELEAEYAAHLKAVEANFKAEMPGWRKRAHLYRRVRFWITLGLAIPGVAILSAGIVEWHRVTNGRFTFWMAVFLLWITWHLMDPVFMPLLDRLTSQWEPGPRPRSAPSYLRFSQSYMRDLMECDLTPKSHCRCRDGPACP